MGSKWSKFHNVFTDEDLNTYSELTYLSPKEILLCYEAFYDLDPETVANDKNAVLPMKTVQKFPALNVNPFKNRICKAFSSNSDGAMSFEDFLDMMSVFNEKAPKRVKIEYAFRIYDFDDDDFISKKDLYKAMRCLLPKEELTIGMIRQITERILEEGDLDDDGGLSFEEFEHIMIKDPDLIRNFRISP